MTADDAGDDHAEADDHVDGTSEALSHLQTTARELIGLARGVLDLAEELVEDPGAIGAVADALGSAVRSAARAGRRAASGLEDDGDGESDAGRSTGSHVQRIRVG